MVAAKNYALNNECVSNNEVLRISSYHSVIRGLPFNRQREHERQGDVAHGNTRSRAQLGKRRTWLPRVQVYLGSLPLRVAIFLCRCGKCARIVNYAVSVNKKYEIVGYIPRINCSAMIAVFMYTLEASDCTLSVYRERCSVVKCIRVIKGVSYAIKLCA